MSEILIKNMVMPKNCCECKSVQTYIYYTDECQYLHKKIAHNGRLKGCPLVEVPPHGRLIDADVIGNWLREQHVFSMPTTCKIDSIINDAPTVIGASN